MLPIMTTDFWVRNMLKFSSQLKRNCEYSLPVDMSKEKEFKQLSCQPIKKNSSKKFLPENYFTFKQPTYF